MSFSENHHTVISISRPRTHFKKKNNEEKNKQPKRYSHKVIKKPSEATLRKYGLLYSKPLRMHELKNEFVLSYRLYTKKVDRIRHRNNLNIDVFNRYKIIYNDLKNRLYVEDSPDDVCAVTDVDSDYFIFFTERSIGKYIPLFKSLQTLYSNSVRARQEIGYRKDCVLHIEAAHRTELQAYNESVQRYKNQVKHFEQFVSEDYKKSMAYLNKSEKYDLEIRNMSIELENLATRKCTLMSQLIGLEYLYGLQQKYGRFLYYLSPPSWRVKHREFAQSIEIEAKGFDFGTSSEEDTFVVIFERMREECFGRPVKPPLYFTHPRDLMLIFEGAEQQQLHHFSYINFLAPHAQMLKKGIHLLKEEINSEGSVVKHMVQRFEKILEFFEEREKFLEARVLRIINGMFYNSVGAPEVLKLGLHIEFCYEKVYNDKPTMDMFMTAKALEEFYMDHCFILDEFKGGSIKRAMKKCMEDERMVMKRAKVASRELRAFNRLENEILKSFKPLVSNQIPALPEVRKKKLRSQVRFDKCLKVRSISKQYELTDAELEYLSLFTDWSENEDPADYIQGLAHSSHPN